MSETAFKDLFSENTENYKAFRPQYPEALFKWLGENCRNTELAWDCGTGNGQAAVHLAKYFKTVIATDPSSEQLKQASVLPNITYRCETSEHSTLEDASADLVCIAQALHWFKFEKFYAEVRRVVKPGGLICAIAYGLPETNAEILEHIRHLHNIILRDYWEQERQLVADLYLDIPFPFEKIDIPAFQVKKEMSKAELGGYLNTWSGLKKMIRITGQNPMPAFLRELEERWPADCDRVTFTWNLALLGGKV